MTTESPHVAKASGDWEWHTPAPIIVGARFTMGGIDLDPASSAIANERVEAREFYDAEQDGLTRAWHGRVWLNPPYARGLVDRFVTRLLDEYRLEQVTQAVVLVNNATETAWGQALLREANVACFPQGRIRYLREDGQPKNAPLQGQMIVGLDVDVVRFVEAFSGIGVVLLGGAT